MNRRKAAMHLMSMAAASGSLLLIAPLFTKPALAQPSRPILVFAGASLQGVLGNIAKNWQAETGKRVVFSFGGSHALARQIEQGAPADIFASADEAWMDWVQTRNLIKPETRVPLIGNRLVLIAARYDLSALRIAPRFGLSATLGQSRLAMANPQAVPAGRYAQQALTAFGVWDDIKAQIAGTENVRAALALVARGEARFGIVYGTDALAEPRVRVIDHFPAESHTAIVYPFAVTSASTNPDAHVFFAYLSSPAARQIFKAEGFVPVR